MASKSYTATGAYPNMYLRLDVNSSSNVSANTSQVNWNLYLVVSVAGNYNFGQGNSVKCVIDGRTLIDTANIGRISIGGMAVGSTVSLGSGSFTTSHGSDGKKSFNVSAQFVQTQSTNASYYISGSYTCDSIPRQAEITSAPDFNDNSNPTIYYKNPAGNAVSALDACISFTGSKDDIAYRAISKTGSSYTFSLSSEEREKLRKNVSGNSKTASVKFYVRTKIGSNTYYSTSSKTFTLQETSTTKPTASVSVSLNNSGLASKFANLCIQGKTKLSVSASGGAKYNASISSYSTVVAGKTYSGSSFTTDAIEATGDVYATTTVKDSRGFTASATSSKVTSIAYSNPSVGHISGVSQVECYRGDDNGDQNNSSSKLYIKAQKNFSTVNGNNRAKLAWRARPSSSFSWSMSGVLLDYDSAQNTYNGTIGGTNFEVTKSYVVELYVQDELGGYNSVVFNIPTDDVPLHLGEGGKAVGIGRYANTEKEYSVSLGWETYIDKPVHIDNERAVIDDASLRFYDDSGKLTATYPSSNAWVKLLDSKVSAAKTYETKTLSQSVNNFRLIAINYMWYGNPSGQFILSVSELRTHASTDNRITFYDSGSSYAVQLYYVSDTKVALYGRDTSYGAVIYGIK